MEEYADEVFNKLNNGAHIYFCGLKGMMPGILAMLEGVAEKKKLVWEDFLKDLKGKGECQSFLASSRYPTRGGRRFSGAISLQKWLACECSPRCR